MAVRVSEPGGAQFALRASGCAVDALPRLRRPTPAARTDQHAPRHHTLVAKRLPEGWKHTYCTLIAEGYTRNDAAKATGVAIGTIDRHQSEDPEFRELYVEARETVRDKVRNRIWAMGMGQSANEVDAATTRWALDHLIKWNLPEAAEKQRVELDVNGSVNVTHEARLTLATVLGLANRLGLSPSSGGELPAAPEILAAPLES